MKSTFARGAALAAVLATGALAVAGAPGANADPKWPTAFVGFGSDTTQDVVGALGGEESGNYFDAATSSVGGHILNSWDATGSACVSPRSSGIAVERANGSGAGRAMLARAVDGTLWDASNITSSCGNKPVGTAIDFARTSSIVTGGSGNLSYLPFGRDAVGFAYITPSGVTPVTSLTSTQLYDIFRTGPITVGSTTIQGCGIQTSSGTRTFFLDQIRIGAGQPAITTAQEDAAVAACTAAGTPGRLQENDGNALANKSAGLAGVQLVIGFSAANYISQFNGVVTSQLPAPDGTVRLGQITEGASDFGVPYVGNPLVDDTLTPNTAFYNSHYGRLVGNILPTSRVTGSPATNQNYKTMFLGESSAVCQAEDIISDFGFLNLPNGDCGAIVGASAAASHANP